MISIPLNTIERLAGGWLAVWDDEHALPTLTYLDIPLPLPYKPTKQTKRESSISNPGPH